MAIEIGELRGIISLQDQFSGPINNVAKALGLSSESFRAVTQFAGLAAAGVAATTGAIVALGIQGGKVATMQDSFDALTRSVGETNDAMLEATRSGTKGLISDFDLMAASNKAILLGLPVTSQSMGTLATAATVLGRAMGQDAKKSLDDLTTALGRSSPLILDNLGLTVKVSEANETYARSLGKSASDLTEAEKKTAFYNAAMTAAQQKVQDLGGIHLTFADRVQQGKVMVENFVDSLGLAVAKSPVVAAGLDTVMKAIQGAFGSDQQQTVKALMGFVNDFAIGLTYVGQVGVVAATVLVTAWAGIELAVLSVLTVIGKVGTGLVSLVAGAAQLANEIPGLRDATAGFASGATKLALAMDEVTAGLAEQTGEANKALAGHSALQQKLDQVGGVLINVRTAMEAAKNATVDLGTAATTGAGGVRDLADAGALSAESAKALELGLRAAQEAIYTIHDEGVANFQAFQEEMALANMNGLERQLADIEMARQRQIASLQQFAALFSAEYERMALVVNEAYARQTASAIESYAAQAAAAVNAGATSVAAAERNLATAKRGYAEMLASGKATYEQLQAARETVDKAEEELDENRKQEKLANIALVAESAADILRSLFGKSKTAAIAAAIIDTFAAVAKTLSAYPWPFSLAPAAAALAAGLAQVEKIRSTDAGFALGTPDTRFLDFGRSSLELLHGHEAVVTPKQAASVAGMVEEALKRQDERMTEELKGLREDLRSVGEWLPTAIAHAGMLARA